MASDEKASRALEKNDQLHRAKLDRLQRQQIGDAAQLKLTAQTRGRAEVQVSQTREAQLTADYQAQWQKLEAEWKSTLVPIYEGIKAANAKAGMLFPP